MNNLTQLVLSSTSSTGLTNLEPPNKQKPVRSARAPKLDAVPQVVPWHIRASSCSWSLTPFSSSGSRCRTRNYLWRWWRILIWTCWDPLIEMRDYSESENGNRDWDFGAFFLLVLCTCTCTCSDAVEGLRLATSRSISISGIASIGQDLEGSYKGMQSSGVKFGTPLRRNRNRNRNNSRVWCSSSVLVTLNRRGERSIVHSGVKPLPSCVSERIDV